MNLRPLALIMALVGTALPAWGTPSDELAAACGPRLMRRAFRQDIRASFTAKYAERIYASEAQNDAYIKLVKGGAPRVHWVVDLALLKALNRDLNNKDLVTALANFHKEILLEEIAKRAPSLRFDLYSDFKSLRLAIAGSVDQATFAALEQAFLEANRRFFSSSVMSQIVRTEDMKKNWFTLGVARSGPWAGDQASLAGRFARVDKSGRPIRYYDDGELQKELMESLARVKALHMQLLNRLGPAGLADGSSQLKLDVFAEGRKLKMSEPLRAALKKLSGVDIGDETAKLLIEYLAAADGFSPNMLVAKRELLTIHDAPYGAISLDFIGLGAENIQATAKALVEADDVSDAIYRARVEEGAVTDRFIVRKQRVEAAAQDFFKGNVTVRFSGDDGIIIPREEFLVFRQMQFIQGLNKLEPRPFFRMVVLTASGAASPISSELITHAENVEKKIRAMMLAKLGPQLSGDLNFEVLTPDTGQRRKLFLFIGSARQLSFAEAEALKSIFPEAVKSFEEDLRQGGGQVPDYEPVDIYSLMGRARRAG